MIAQSRGDIDIRHDFTQTDAVIERISAGAETRADRDVLASILLQAVHDSLYLTAGGHPMRPGEITIAVRRSADSARRWLAGPIAALYLLHLDIDPAAAVSRLRKKWADVDRFAYCDPVMH
ncbi:hypothetical protein [Acidithiobacillus ferrooxidans]|uniref:hypothetical protein n=1 Tax=Acidithiobacillus ferrooxidans TaxID=920 RepID=UPI0013D6C1B5|nr:hypothetical protein [Acidithiobacillus ferrooxidans]